MMEAQTEGTVVAKEITRLFNKDKAAKAYENQGRTALVRERLAAAIAIAVLGHAREVRHVAEARAVRVEVLLVVVPARRHCLVARDRIVLGLIETRYLRIAMYASNYG
jgi:hypothetical protein